MKKLIFPLAAFFVFAACDKQYVCNCSYESSSAPHKKVYLQAKSDNGAERQCNKQAVSGESCKLQ